MTHKASPRDIRQYAQDGAQLESDLIWQPEAEAYADYRALISALALPDYANSRLSGLNAMVSCVRAAAFVTRTNPVDQSTAELQCDIAWNLARGLSYTDIQAAMAYAAYALRRATEIQDRRRMIRSRGYLGGCVFGSVPGLRVLSDRYLYGASQLAGDDSTLRAVCELWVALRDITSASYDQCRVRLDRIMPTVLGDARLDWEHQLVHLCDGYIAYHQSEFGRLARVAKALEDLYPPTHPAHRFSKLLGASHLSELYTAYDNPHAYFGFAEQAYAGWNHSEYDALTCYRDGHAMRTLLYMGRLPEAVEYFEAHATQIRQSALWSAPNFRSDHHVLHLQVSAHTNVSAMPAIAANLRKLYKAEAHAYARWADAAFAGNEIEVYAAAEDFMNIGMVAWGEAVLMSLDVSKGDALKALLARGIVNPERWARMRFPKIWG